jgi:hypothetical protein
LIVGANGECMGTISASLQCPTPKLLTKGHTTILPPLHSLLKEIQEWIALIWLAMMENSVMFCVASATEGAATNELRS